MKIALFVVLAILFGACSIKKAPTHSKILKLHKQQKASKTPYKPKSKNWITLALYDEYKKWYKTPYKYGGICLQGVDCSALVQIIYKDAFNINLPRTTKNQVKLGYKVGRNSTKEGDLVFFKTGYNTRHVGIIIEKGKFINTSSKYGVTVSELNNPYWKSKYWQSRRILPY